MKCPECGKEMEKGMLEYGNQGFLYGMRWWIGAEEGQSTIGKKSVVFKRIGSTFGSFGYRCPECQLIVLRYR